MPIKAKECFAELFLLNRNNLSFRRGYGFLWRDAVCRGFQLHLVLSRRELPYRIGFEKYDVVVEALDPSHILDKDPQ